MEFIVKFETSDLGAYSGIPGLKEAMESELVRAHNYYAEKSNAGITDMLNRMFDEKYPHMTDKNRYADKYNRFMADGYQRLIVMDMNRNYFSPILIFEMEREECELVGHLRVDFSKTTRFYLVQKD